MKYKIIILVLFIFIMGAYLFVNSHSEMDDSTTIILTESSYIKVPNDSNATSKVDEKGIFYYKSDINITSSSDISSPSSIDVMKKIKNSVIVKSKKITQDNIIIYEKDGIYSIFAKNTRYNDTLIIQSADKNLLIQSIMTLKYHDPTDDFKIDNVSTSDSSKIINAVDKTQKTVKTTESSGTSEGYDWSYGDSSKTSKSSSKTYSTSNNVGGAASSAQFDFN